MRSSFQFTEAAKLYARHPNIPDIIEEMRQESYRSIGEFRKALIVALRAKLQPAKLCLRTTNTTGRYAGAEIQHLWQGVDADTEWRDGVAKLWFFCPLPDNVKDEKLWRGSLALVSEGTLSVYGSHDGPASELALVIRKVRELGFEVEREGKGQFTCQVHLDLSDPVGSAADQLAGLLRAIGDATRA